MKETELYAPIKAYLESSGYEVKAEVAAADVVAIRRNEPPIIVELKTSFTLSLFQQAIERQQLTDNVYVAVPALNGPRFRKSLKKNHRLCRRLGLGMITVREHDGQVVVHCDPAPYQPRKSKHKQSRLVREFVRREGDPNTGGSTRTKLMTAYRQDAIRCATYLRSNGATKASAVAAGTKVDRARHIMARNHYGWFERVSTGIYQLTDDGRVALQNSKIS